MVRKLYLFASLLITAFLLSSCDNDDTQPAGIPEKIEVDCIAQFENSMFDYINVEATWRDADGTLRHATPIPHYLEHGNRQYSRITVKSEYLKLPATTDITLTYTVKDGVIDEEGFVDIPKEGVDIIVYTGVTVDNTYSSGKNYSHTYDIVSYIKQNVQQDEFIETVEYLNKNCGRIFVWADSNGAITTNEQSEGNSHTRPAGRSTVQ